MYCDLWHYSWPPPPSYISRFICPRPLRYHLSMSWSRPEWMSWTRPEWMSQRRPEWMSWSRPEWMSWSRPEWLDVDGSLEDFSRIRRAHRIIQLQIVQQGWLWSWFAQCRTLTVGLKALHCHNGFLMVCLSLLLILPWSINREAGVCAIIAIISTGSQDCFNNPELHREKYADRKLQ